ncbi:MAG: aminoacyl-tRNA hydrolase [Candidatus Magasanikbacteria bacterium]|nr:aminoacyl-tRNA hydrolase [Candidatus Magasanikbacteria bacterium]
MYLIVGLGNPGKEYERTRHNAGFLVLDALAGDESWSAGKKAQALFIKTEINNKRVELLKPTTFMNNSGVAVTYAMKNHNLTPNDIVVIHDDKDIPLGEFKIQRDRGAAGHNGVLSIIKHLSTKNFLRIRVGIGFPSPGGRGTQGEGSSPAIVNTADFVLAKFTQDEQKILHGVIKNVVEEVKKLLVTS